MKYYIKQQHNPKKHELMNNDYPWQVSDSPTGSPFEIAVTDEQYESIVNSIDISEFLQETQESKYLRQQRLQRQWGQKYIDHAVDLVGAKNIELDKAGMAVNTVALLQSLGAIKELLNTGALKTARNLCLQLQPVFPAYSDTFNKMITDINTFMYENNF